MSHEWKSRRKEYLQSTGRFHTLIAEGLIEFGVHQGGRSRYTPMVELNALCLLEPNFADPEAELTEEPKEPVRDVVCRLRKRGLKGREIAERLRMPASSVRGILARAAKRGQVA